MSRARRAIVLFALVAVYLVAFHVPVVAASGSLQVASVHTTGSDFNSGSYTNMSVSGSGQSASLDLKHRYAKTVDTFNDGNLNEYNTAGGAGITSNSYEGGYALKLPNTAGNPDYALSSSGLSNYPQQGDTISFYYLYNDSSGGHVMFDFGASGTNPEASGFSGYQVFIGDKYNKFAIKKYSSGSGSTLTSTSFNPSAYSGKWMHVVVKWRSSGKITVSLSQAGGSTLSTMSATDTSYTGGAYGFESSTYSGYADTLRFDDVTIKAVGYSGQYTSASHSVTDSQAGFTDLTNVAHVSVNVTWETYHSGGWHQVSSATYTTAGNKTQTWATSSDSSVRVIITVTNLTKDATFSLASEGVEFTARQPTVTNSSASPGGDVTLHNGQPTFSIPVSDGDFATAQSDSLNLDWYVNGTKRGTTTVTSNGTASFTPSSNLTDGPHSWHVVVTDSYGLSTTSTTSTFTVTHFTPAVDNANASPQGDPTFHNQSNQLSIPISDKDFAYQGDTLTVNWYVDGSQRNTTTLNSNGTATVSTGGLADGSHTWHVVVADSYGNSVTSQTFTYTITHSPPSLNNSTATPTGGKTFYKSPINASLGFADGDFARYDGDNVTIQWYLDGSVVSTEYATQNQTLTHAYSITTDGQHTWHVVASDSYGYVTSSQTFTINRQHYPPNVSGIHPNTTSATVSTSPFYLNANVSDGDFGTSANDQLTLNWYVDGVEQKSTSAVANGSVSAQIPGLTSGKHSWHVEVIDSYGNSVNSSIGYFLMPSTLYVYNESNPTKLVKNATVDIRIYVNETGTPSVFKKSTSDGAVNMSGVPANKPFVVVASTENYTSRRIFVPSLYESHNIFLLPKSAKSSDTIFSISDYTGLYPKSDTVLLVQRSLNGSYKTVLGDYFGATGQFPGKLAYNTRHRLVLLNVKTGRRRVMGSYTPLTAQTQTVVVAPNGGIKRLGLQPSANVRPGIGRLPALNNTTLSFSLLNHNSSVSKWHVWVNSSSGTVWSTTRSSPGAFTHDVNLANLAGESVTVHVNYATANGSFTAKKKRYHVMESPSSQVSLLGNIESLVQLSPQGSRDQFTAFLAMGLTILSMAAIASQTPASSDIVGLSGVLFLVGFAALGWVGWDLVFVSGVGLVGFAALRSGV